METRTSLLQEYNHGNEHILRGVGRGEVFGEMFCIWVLSEAVSARQIAAKRSGEQLLRVFLIV